jgi:hypothetical protein
MSCLLLKALGGRGKRSRSGEGVHAKDQLNFLMVVLPLSIDDIIDMFVAAVPTFKCSHSLHLLDMTLQF